jgi:hypothetical protein
LNSDWFNYEELVEKPGKFKFRDGTTLTILDHRLPSVWLSISKLEQVAISTDEDPRQQAFAWAVYPKLAGCSRGQVPTLDEAYHFPSTELNKWYAAVEKVNPNLFEDLKKVASEELKKKEKNELK